MIRIGRDLLGNLDASLRREWLETKGNLAEVQV